VHRTARAGGEARATAQPIRVGVVGHVGMLTEPISRGLSRRFVLD
jgi:hypothetical protein